MNVAIVWISYASKDQLILVLKPTQDHAILREDVKVFLQLAQMWHFMGLICLED
jgi:hypothetical protein